MLQMLQMIGSGSAQKLYADDVFAAWLRTGTGADVITTTGIDMTKGYCLHSKSRSAATDHAVYHSARGLTKDLATNLTSGETTQATGLKAVSSTGYTIGSLAKMNTLSAIYVDWIFRDAPKFHAHAVVNKTAGSNAAISFPELETLGMVRVKRMDAAGSWYVWHRSLSAGQLLIGETTAAAATLGHITVSGTTVTLVNGVIADGSYLVEAFANDPSADGLIQCGSFTTDASGNATVDLGFEPQFLMFKTTNSPQNWVVFDVMRGIANGGVAAKVLQPNTSNAEADSFQVDLTSVGFVSRATTGFTASRTYIYLVIRRPNKPPTTGTEVFNPIATNAGSATGFTFAGRLFDHDLVLGANRTQTGYGKYFAHSRLTGSNRQLTTAFTIAETDFSGSIDCPFDRSRTFYIKENSSNGSWCYDIGSAYSYLLFKRAPGFLDVVCDTGAGVAHAIAHNLTKPPELIIRKSRSVATQWEVWHSALTATEKLVLHSDAAKATDATAWGSTPPTATQFTVGTGANVNAYTATFVTYLFATLAGISKVGSYTGNGSSQTINCGFSAGARFFLVKATSTTGSWWIFDSARGIVSAADPALQLNSTPTEITSADAVDPTPVGIIVNQEATCSINTNGVSYAYLAIA